MTGCGAPQLGKELNPKDLKKLKHKRCKLVFLAIILSPVILLLITSVVLSIVWLDLTEKRDCVPQWLRYGLTPLIFIVGIPLTLIAVPCALIYGIIWLIIRVLCCCTKHGNASKNKLNAMERIKELTDESYALSSSQ